MVPSPLLILLQSRLLRFPKASHNMKVQAAKSAFRQAGGNLLSQLGMLQLLLLWSMPGLRELVSARVLLLPYTMPMEPSFLLTRLK